MNDNFQKTREYNTADSLPEKIDAGIGSLYWGAENLQLISLMETIGEHLKKSSPLEIERRIRG